MVQNKTLHYLLDALGLIILVIGVVTASRCFAPHLPGTQDPATAHAQVLAPATDTAPAQEVPSGAGAGLTAEQAPEPVEAAAEAPWTELEVEIARLAMNEATGREADTIGITQARMHWSLERLRREHPRALAATGTGRRPWIAGLNAELTVPEGWDESAVPWERGRRVWLRTLQTVRRTMAGGLRCAGGRPQIWGGRTLDARHIQRRLSQGYRFVDCGPTLNAFMRRDQSA